MHKNIYCTSSKACFLQLFLLVLAFASVPFSAKAQAFSESFETGIPAGWAQQNLSSPFGPSVWVQLSIGNLSPSQDGTFHLICNHNSTMGTGTISNWLFTPMVTLSNGDVFSFYTRTVPSPVFPDRMQVRMSTNGASVDVGASATSVGDFTTLLVDVNPTYTQTGYPNAWTQFSVTLSGLGAPISGRFAFRYFVEGGGPSGFNSDRIGLDNVVYTPFVVLPITLINFSAYPDGHRNQLRWATSSERNNSGFEVQRSTDGINYAPLGFVKSPAAGGNSTSRLSYAFTDNSVTGSSQYYRLRQVDLDGHGTISHSVLIKDDKPLTLQVEGLFPNPADQVVNVLIAAPNEDKITVLVTDIAGQNVLQQVLQVETGRNTLPLDISSLSAGTYMVKLVCGSNCGSAVSKFTKQ